MLQTQRTFPVTRPSLQFGVPPKRKGTFDVRAHTTTKSLSVQTSQLQISLTRIRWEPNGPPEPNPSLAIRRHPHYNLRFPKASFLPEEATYICNMIWFKKMPSTKSMYRVKLSWWPLPNGPKVFTCGEAKACWSDAGGGQGRPGRSPTTAVLFAGSSRARQQTRRAGGKLLITFLRRPRARGKYINK